MRCNFLSVPFQKKILRTVFFLGNFCIGHVVVDLLDRFGLDRNKCVGIGTDNCSVMASDLKGAVAELRKHCPTAQRCPCQNHALNSSIAQSAKVPQCRNTDGTMTSVISVE